MPVEIFCCYTRKDESLLQRLKIHLMALQRQGLITLWADTDINGGAEWEHEIDKHLNTAQIILLLVSPDFIASEYCYSKEMKRAMERHDCGEALVIPIILRPTLWKDTLFGKLQALPKDGKPVNNWKDDEDAFYDVADRIQKTIVKVNINAESFSLPRRTAIQIYISAFIDRLKQRVRHIRPLIIPFLISIIDRLKRGATYIRPLIIPFVIAPLIIIILGLIIFKVFGYPAPLSHATQNTTLTLTKSIFSLISVILYFQSCFTFLSGVRRVLDDIEQKELILFLSTSFFILLLGLGIFAILIANNSWDFFLSPIIIVSWVDIGILVESMIALIAGAYPRKLSFSSRYTLFAAFLVFLTTGLLLLWYLNSVNFWGLY